MRRQLCTISRKHGLPQLRPITLDANSEEFMGYKRLAIAVLIRATEDLVYEGTNGNEPVKDAIAFLVNPDRLLNGVRLDLLTFLQSQKSTYLY